ncbi:hypothetical protein AB6V29_14485 [Microbacterium sp. 20-116]|uniref:hypothetical protein n=1 Tax=Microbacterium sp. 20-116 TaxID=3239883 RepID=UPI0034E25B52
MENASDRGAPHLLRLLLVGVSTALGAAALSVALSASPASADDGSGGLLGTIGSTVNQVTDTVDDVVGTVVSPTVEHVTETVAPVTEVVTDVAPAPVAEVVATTTDTVSEVVDTANTTVDGAVGTAGDAVTDIAGSGVVGGVVTPVVETVQSVPVVGDVVHAVGLDDLISGVTDAVDAALPVIVGTLPPISPVVPAIPGISTDPGGEATTPIVDALPLEPLPVEAAADSAVTVPGAPSTGPSPVSSSPRTAPSGPVATLFAAATGGDASATLASAQNALQALPTDVHVDLGASTGSGSSASGNSGAGGANAATTDGGKLFAAPLLLDRRNVVDDGLPGTPVFGTDISPD